MMSAPKQPEGGMRAMDEAYRTCACCGRDCEPEGVPTEHGIRIAFLCPEHGVHTIIDPFKAQR